MKKTYLVGALMIGASMIFVRPIKAQANPVAGVTRTIENAHLQPPIAQWQQDILYVGMEEDDKPKKRKVKKVQKKKENNNEERNNDSSTRCRNRKCLNRSVGVFTGPSGKETFYNLNMGGCIRLMEALGYSYRYWVRDDGCKMYGDYIMCAANLNIRPKGTIVETSLGRAIVCDTGGFAVSNPYQLDIATTW